MINPAFSSPSAHSSCRAVLVDGETFQPAPASGHRARSARLLRVAHALDSEVVASGPRAATAQRHRRQRADAVHSNGRTVVCVRDLCGRDDHRRSGVRAGVGGEMGKSKMASAEAATPIYLVNVWYHWKLKYAQSRKA